MSTGPARVGPVAGCTLSSAIPITTMKTHDELPDTDPDLRLARVLGDRSVVGDDDGIATLGPDDANLVAQLERLRDERLSRAESAPGASMWAAVASRTVSRPGARIYRLASWRTMTAAAAVVLVLILFSVFRLVRPDFDVLLESGAERAVFTTSDGSSITLRPHSRLVQYRDDTYALEGEGYFVVAPQESQSFVVATEDATVSVLGTQFVVATWSGRTSVFLEEGRIRLDAQNGDASDTLSPGDARTVDGDGVIASVPTDSTEALDWLRDEISFVSQPLGDIVSELGHHFDVSIEVSDADAAISLSGRVLLTSRQDALDDLATILDGEFVERDGTFRLVRRAR